MALEYGSVMEIWLRDVSLRWVESEMPNIGISDNGLGNPNTNPNIDKKIELILILILISQRKFGLLEKGLGKKI